MASQSFKTSIKSSIVIPVKTEESVQRNHLCHVHQSYHILPWFEQVFDFRHNITVKMWHQLIAHRIYWQSRSSKHLVIEIWIRQFLPSRANNLVIIIMGKVHMHAWQCCYQAEEKWYYQAKAEYLILSEYPGLKCKGEWVVPLGCEKWRQVP